MAKEKKGKFVGISLRAVIIGMFCVGIVVSVRLFIAMNRTTESYNAMAQATVDYIECQDNVYVIWDAINDLSERARNFVVTGSPEEVILFFNEVQVQRSRDQALATIKSHLVDAQTLKHLDLAMQLSERMVNTECYAMRLGVEAYGYDISKYPARLRETELKEEDLARTAEEQKEIASKLLFDKEYTLLKSQVDIRINLCKNALIAAMETKHKESAELLQKLLINQKNLIFAMMGTLLLVCIFVLSLVIYPLNRLITGISEGSRLKIRGASEIKFLSDTYNRMHEEMEDANNKLGYEATHDALTGLYNRSSYDDIRQKSKDKSIALIIVDVDLFKEMNDTYGHDIGDKVLIRVAQVLLRSFREADMVCRIGGDEFSVIMMNVHSSMREVLRSKITGAADMLRVPEDDVPGVTISVGVAFSDQLKPDGNLFKNADRALYQIKEQGRNGCGFYSEEMA